MNSKNIIFRKLSNTLQSIFILALMLLLLALIGYIIAGESGFIWAAVFGLIFMILSPRISPNIVLRMYRARELSPDEAEGLFSIIRQIAERAHLKTLPSLYYLPSSMLNAFTVGSRGNASIALTDGLLRNLNWREITGVLAHEISHIRNNDLWIMGLADSMSRLTHAFSFVGQIMFFIYIPIFFISGIGAPLLVIVLLIIAPLLSVLLQLALSRTREFESDLDAVRLTNDPSGLASALQKIERYPRSIWNMVLMPGRKVPDPSVLRTHPDTQRRIERLMKLSGDEKEVDYPGLSVLPESYSVIKRQPRWRIGGIWY